jgi:hypothetical protein
MDCVYMKHGGGLYHLPKQSFVLINPLQGSMMVIFLSIQRDYECLTEV